MMGSGVRVPPSALSDLPAQRCFRRFGQRLVRWGAGCFGGVLGARGSNSTPRPSRRRRAEGPPGSGEARAASGLAHMVGQVEWSLPLRGQPGGPTGLRDDLPLSDELPDQLVLDVSDVREQPHPLFMVRLRAFVDWHRARGRELQAVGRPAGKRILSAHGFADVVDEEPPPNADVVIPARSLTEELAVDRLAEDVRGLMEFELIDVSPLADAVFQALSELCSNALQHGRHDLGVFVAAKRRIEPRRQISIAIGDLGVGIPEHIRGRYPEWTDDCAAIARAMQPGVSGTGDPHRGYGFDHTFQAALTSALHGARIDIHSARGFVRREFVQERDKVTEFPQAQFRRGTLISWELTSALA
jgi:hypothetical protein